MKKIIGVIHPFDFKQIFLVYDDKTQIAKAKFSMDELADGVINLSNQYGINQIDLMGTKSYTQGLKEQIQEKEISKYNKTNLEINLI